jgi:hypothetical protein
MSGSKIRFGDSLPLVQLKNRARLDEYILASPLASAALRRRAEQEQVDIAYERLRSAGAPAVPVVAVTRAKRAKRARVNTIAPSVYSGGFRVVYSGIDSYDANVLGDVRWDFLSLLPGAKEDAEAVGGLALAPLPPFLGENLAIKNYGGGTFAYLMGNADVTANVRKAGHAPTMAAAQVKLTAECLHRLGHVEALRALAAWVALWAPGATLQVSAVDLCADTQGWQPTAADFAGSRSQWAFVCPVERPTLIPYDDYYGYVRFGTGGQEGSRSGSSPIQNAIYDKTDDIRVKDKGWFVPLWARSAGYKDGEIVTRVEYRYRREFLKERGIETQEQLLASLGALWLAGLEWCRYSVPPVEGGDTNRSRLEVRPEWQVLAGVDWGVCADSGLQRIDQARPKLERTLAAIGGHLVTLQALLAGAMVPDLRAVADMAVPALLHRWDARGESYERKVSDRVLKLGGLALC